MHVRLLLTFLLIAASVRATTVVPPEFPDLVAEAEAIYRGRVTDVVARRVPNAAGNQFIKTFVTFSVERTLKGPEQREVVLEFLGGTLGDESLSVGGVPKFNPGEREILFVQKNGLQFCPLVRLGHGRYRVERDVATGRDYVSRENKAPLASVSDVQLPLAETPVRRRAAAANSLTAEDFEAQIRAEVDRPSGRDRAPASP